jgi:hypothetical protein
MAKPSDNSPIERPASDRTAAGKQKNNARTVPSTATRPHVDSVFVPTFGAAIRAEIGMAKLRRGVDEFAGWKERTPLGYYWRRNLRGAGALAGTSVGSEQFIDGRHRGRLAEPRVDLLDVGACEDARASLFGDAHAA